jgi:DNA replication and repair protein RecF
VIDWLALENFRNISAARIEAAGANIGIVGPNASGKTSVLEALFFLGHGRSFRTADRRALIARGHAVARVICGLGDAPSLRAGVELSSSGIDLRVCGGPSTVREMASLLPIQLVDPSIHLLVEEGSARRRRIFDWGVFHVEPQFGESWRAYHRAVRQRNAALRNQAWSIAEALGAQLAAIGGHLDEMRARYFQQLQPVFNELRSELLDEAVVIDYRRGWRPDLTLGDALISARETDHRLRTTTVGPHRADLRITLHARLARELISRGQQKLLASALVLSQARLLASVLGRKAALLIDDPAAELDVDNLGKLLRAVTKTPAQVIATSLTPEGLRGVELTRMFHVKQGQLDPML